MPLVIPSALELKTLRQLVRFAGQRVLEIGVGDGRLAWPLAPEALQWMAVEPDLEDLALAKEEREKDKDKDKEKVWLLGGDARALSFPDEYFDIAFFSWSLC